MAPQDESYRITKPELPYVVGRELTVNSHSPPVPQPEDEPIECMYDRKTIRQWKLVSPLLRCVINRPLPGNPGNGRAKLEIVQHIRAGDKKSAQVVLVQVISSSTTELEKAKRLVAKIYDPLYFDHEQDDVIRFPLSISFTPMKLQRTRSSSRCKEESYPDILVHIP